MNSSTVKWVGFFAALLVATCCIGLLWVIAYHLLIARLNGPSFTTDQILASLGVMVTGLGLFIAIAAVGIAVLAIFGFSELRSMVDRRIDEGFRTVKNQLRKKNLLDDKDEDENVADLAERVDLKVMGTHLGRKEDERFADLVERVESSPTPIESIKTKGAGSGQSSGADVPEPESLHKGNLPVSGNVVATGAELPIAGEYPQGKEDEEV